MKKIFIVFIIVCSSLPVLAQQKRAVLSGVMQNKAVLSPKWNGQGELPFHPNNNTVVNKKNVNDDVIGGSRYDNQTNGSIKNRLYLWPDGSLSASWIFGMDDATTYNDRGTGYNYNDGTAWGPAPTSRIETTRTGWVNLNPWNGSGEITFAHNSTATLVMCTRPAKGTGSWTQSNAPTGPTGVTTLLWPSSMTSGSNNQYIHIIAIGQPNYQGMSDALLYFRSLDGGATWDKQGVVLPGMTVTDELGYAGDDYAWATPRGDTIAFVVAGNWEDGFIMKSVDNGNTWTKTVFFDNPYKLTPISVVVPTFWCLDGSNAIQLDNTGKAHVAVGRMRANGDGSARYYFPGTDGLLYWTEGMPVMDTTRLSDLDTLDAHHQLIGYVASDAAGDSIVGFPYYGVCLSAYPQIIFDSYGNIDFIWSGLTVGNPDPTPYNYRHTWGRKWLKDFSTFGSMTDFNSDFVYIFQEFAFPAIAPTRKNQQIQLIYQTSSQPGSNIQYASVPVHDVSIAYNAISLLVGVQPDPVVSKNQVSQNYPNPVTGTTQVNVNLDKPGIVNVDVTDLMGQKVMVIEKGILSSGAHRINLDCSTLRNGIYLLTVTINGEAFTHRMIKESSEVAK